MTLSTPLMNVNISGSSDLVSPNEIKKELPLPVQSEKTILESRQVLQNILDRKDPRLFCVVGPCSIHDVKAAVEYAERLAELAHQVREKIYLVMRVYFEKPRTTVGWKGLINDPYLDDSFKIEEGLKIARKLLIDITKMGLPTGTEALDPITPQYLSELISWSAIGARTTESQTHRELASGLSMPVGFKNGTDGTIASALNALKSASRPHSFLGINQDGRIAKFLTRGNAYAHLVLRGGENGPNYGAAHIVAAENDLIKNGLRNNIVVDCSHANSNKDHRLQPKVLSESIDQIKAGNKSIVGFMIESHLFEGNQPIPADLSQLKYGVSVTDKCVDWKTTEEILIKASQQL